MMNYVFAGLIILAAVWSIYQGNPAATAQAILRSGGDTVQLLLTVAGAMSVWSGIMAVAEKAGLTEYATRLLRPAIRRLFPGLHKGGEAERYVCMNIVANLLGLGNAATPLGLRAMNAMRDEGLLIGGRAGAEMMTFVVLNTASLQLLPTTLLVLRTEAGAAEPMDILPCIWLSSLAALTAGLLMCTAFRTSAHTFQKRQKGD